jgi:hypothetical protein
MENITKTVSEVLNELVGKSFMIEGKAGVYTCKEVKQIKSSPLHVVKTDRQSFPLLPSQIDEFIDSLRYCMPAVDIVAQTTELAPAAHINPEIAEIVGIEIMKAGGMLGRVSSKMERMFDILADEPSQEQMRQADAMVKASNAIVAMTMGSFKIATYKKHLNGGV